MNNPNLIQDSATREEALTKLWGERSVFEKEDELEKFEEIEKQIKEIPVLNLAVAIDLGKEDLVKIREKMIVGASPSAAGRHDSPLPFIEVRVDPGLIAGCIFVWKGQVFDYSLRKTMVEKKLEFRKIVMQLM